MRAKGGENGEFLLFDLWMKRSLTQMSLVIIFLPPIAVATSSSIVPNLDVTNSLCYNRSTRPGHETSLRGEKFEPARASIVKARASARAWSITRPLPRVDNTTDFAFCFSSPLGAELARDSLSVDELARDSLSVDELTRARKTFRPFKDRCGSAF